MAERVSQIEIGWVNFQLDGDSGWSGIRLKQAIVDRK